MFSGMLNAMDYSKSGNGMAWKMECYSILVKITHCGHFLFISIQSVIFFFKLSYFSDKVNTFNVEITTSREHLGLLYLYNLIIANVFRRLNAHNCINIIDIK